MPQGVFSLTQEPQFTERQVPMVPGTDVMQGSVIPNTPIVPGGINTQNLVPFPFNYESGMIAETTDDNDETTIFDQVRNYFTDPSKNTQRGLLSLALTGNPVLAALGFFAPRIAETGGGIMDTIKDKINQSKGRVDIDQTSDYQGSDPGTVGGSSYDSDTGGTFGSSVDDASSFSDYS
mgnify:CR=1 FL=1